MKRIILASLILAVATRFSQAGEDPVARQLLITAEQKADLFSHDASPLQLEVDFVAQVQVPTQGHLTYRWEASDRYWRKVSMGDFQQIDIKNGDRLYTSRNAPFTPVRTLELLSVIHVGENPNRVQIRKQKQRVEGGLAITCLQLHGQMRGDKP